MDNNVNPTELIVDALRAQGLSSEQILEAMIQGGFQAKTFEKKNESVEIKESKILSHIQKENKLKDLLLDLGIPRHLRGYRYIIRAVLLYEENPDQMMTKEIYPTVAKEFNVKGEQVERSIRHAIECAWKRCPIEVQEKFFGSTVSLNKCKPTNSEFIAICAERLRQYQ